MTISANGAAAAGPELPRVSSGGYSAGVEERLSDNISGPLLIAFLIRSAVAGFAAFLLFGIVDLLVFLIPGNFGQHSVPQGLVTLTGLVAFITSIVMLIVPYREDLGSWHALVDDRAEAADSAYAAVFGALRNRELPVEATPQRISNDFGFSATRNYLVVRHGKYVVYVSAFGYGTALYLSWTMWRVQRPIVMFGVYVKQRLAALSGHGTLFHQMLRAEVAGAFREAVHLSVQDGVDVALMRLQVPMTATFGYDVPVSDASSFGAYLPPLPPLPPLPSPGQPAPSAAAGNGPR